MRPKNKWFMRFDKPCLLNRICVFGVYVLHGFPFCFQKRQVSTFFFLTNKASLLNDDDCDWCRHTHIYPWNDKDYGKTHTLNLTVISKRNKRRKNEKEIANGKSPKWMFPVWRQHKLDGVVVLMFHFFLNSWNREHT